MMGEYDTPDGWVLVPEEPTEAMIEAGRDVVVSHAWGNGGEYILDPETIYKAMLAALNA